MHPVLTLAVGEWYLHVTSYRLFFLLAAASTIGLGLAVAIRRGLPWRRSLILVLATAMAIPVGARLLDLATKPEIYQREPRLLWSLDLNGLSMYGGLALAAATGVLLCRVLGLDLARMADSVAPGLGVGLAVMRMGCFMAGCCFGKETDLPWGVTFPHASNSHIHQVLQNALLFRPSDPLPVHPTQLYELLAALGAAVLALWLMRRGVPDGSAFLAGVCWFCAFRLVNHQLRVPGGALAAPEWFYPALYTLLLVVAGAALLLRWRAAGEAWSPGQSEV